MMAFYEEYLIRLLLVIAVLCFPSYWAFTHFKFNPSHHIGDVVDEFNNVKVYYNGSVNNVIELDLAPALI